MKELELGDDGFQFISSYTTRTCYASLRSLGVAGCADMSTQRRVLHETIEASLRCQGSPPRFRLMSEYHAWDANNNLRAMAGYLPRWRAAAAPLGCKVLVIALVRDPIRWYISHVAYSAHRWKQQPKGGTLESAVRHHPNAQASLLRTHWRRAPLEAAELIDIFAPLENITTFAALVCHELGVVDCPKLQSANGFHGTPCVVGLGRALMHNETHVLPAGPVQSEEQLRALCSDTPALLRTLAHSTSLRAAVAEHASLDAQLHQMAHTRFAARVARARANGFDASGFDEGAPEPAAAYKWIEAMPPFPADTVRVGQPLPLLPHSHCTHEPGTYVYRGNRILVPA